MGIQVLRRILALLTVVWVCLAGPDAHALDPTRGLKQFRHTAWTRLDGMPANISSIAQTPDGYLWLGADSGLYRFDGVRVEPFTHPLPGVSVFSLAVSSTGDLWIGSSTGLSRLSHGVLTTVTAPRSIPSAGVLHIAPGRNGEVFVATMSQVARVDGQGWHVMASDWGSSEGYTKPGGIWGLAVARDGVVWSKNLLGLYYLRPGAKGFLKADAYGGSIIDFARAPDGRLWTGDTTLKHFYALPDLGPSGAPPPSPQVGAPLAPGVQGHALLDRDGVLWAANPVSAFGLYRVRSVAGPRAVVEAFAGRDGLTSDVARMLFEDREGDIWVATAQGLDRFSPANVVTESAVALQGRAPDISASADAVYVADGFAPDSPGRPKGHEHLYRIARGAPERLMVQADDATVLNAAGSDGVLYGSGRPLFRLRDGVATTIDLPKSIDIGHVESAAESGHVLWAAIAARGVFRRRGDTWAPFTAPGVNPAGSSGLRFDQQGALWIAGTLNGAMDRVIGDHIDTYAGANGPNVGTVNVFVPDADGVLVGGLLGVSRFDGQRFRTLSHDQAPYLNETMGIVADDRGGTWLHTANGIYRVDTGQLQHAFLDRTVRLDAQLFDARDGLTSTAAVGKFGSTAVRGPDGRLWFLNVSNLVWIDPQHLYRDPVAPPVAIRGITADGHVYGGERVVKLPAGASNLQIDYTALSLQNPDRVRFRYRLEGVDKTWIDAGGRREAFYTRLGPGHYRFQVIAANNDGVWNTTGATVRFKIPPTFVQRPEFLALCAILAGAALWLAYTLRIRQLASAIQARLEERLDERERIARELHDTLLQGFQGLVLRLQAVMEGLPGDQPAQAELDAVLTRADEVLIAGRNRVRDLRTLDRPGGLAAALSDAAQAMAGTGEARFQLAVEGGPRGLHPIVGEELAAIGREAISNAFRHAGAGTIDVRLIYSRWALTLRIVDDGVGMPRDVVATGRSGHFGLLGMRERADKIDAKLELSSPPGVGVQVAVTVPAGVAFVTGPNTGGLDWLRETLAAFLRRRRAAP
ncbi:sensor histidine kinase [Phenylobacterium sp.]|uniref:sensor histidine kinase n=1 Tax=Phenylobacterium sp. TaxID=1871053 RepID=UPI00120C2C42|nr:sensor histidine kinase [Phenylobacterium sp.]THD63867.1 MAG: hypothetical protein E8A49_04090 [Phenylobacterium sp.]